MKLFLALGVTAAVAFAGAPKALAQAYTATNIWTGAGGDPYWPTAGNWTNSIVPTPSSLVLLTNFGISGLPGTNGSGAVGTPNIIVSNDTSVASLHVMNTNMFGASAMFHTILISNGVTLTVSNNPTAPQINVIQVCSQSAAGAPSAIGSDYGVGSVIHSTIQGAGGTLAVVATNGLGTTFARGNIFAGQGSLGLSAAPTIDPLNAILDLSGLDNFRVDANHILLGDGGIGGFFFNRPAGTIYLAKTNQITLWAVGNHPSGGSTANHGLMTGIIAQNNGGGLTRLGRFVLGQTNAIFCNTGIGLGIRGCSGWLGFNPSNAPGSVAYFRNRAGTGRQTSWAIGHRLGAGSLANVSGELDFSQGTVDAQVGTMGIAVSGVGNTTIGTVSFGAGTIDVNTLQVGFQSGASGGPVQGTLNVSNTAVLIVNTAGVLGGMTGSPLAGTYFGRLNIIDGAQVLFGSTAPLTCGIGNSSEIKLINGSTLKVLSIGTPAVPLTSLQISNSTLTVDRGVLSNPTVAPIVVQDLDAAHTNVVNVLGTVLVAGRFPLIKYTTLVNGGFTNFVLGSTSPGVSAYLTNNAANSSIDVVVTSSVTTVLTWNGRTNSVDVGDWEINAPTNWQGGLAYSQVAVPGSLVRFDDTAAGTTTVTFTNLNLAPADILVTNSSKNYTFTGTGGLVGPGALTKDGDGSLLLSNSGSNGFTGGVLINAGTLQIGGSPNRLPTNGIVTFADAVATLDLNNLDQTVAALVGGGASGGNIALGSGNLFIRSGGGNYAGVISGAGALVKQSSGTQTLTGANTYSGGTVISNSALLVLNSTGSGLGSGPITIGAGGTLQLGNGVVDGSVSTAYITNNGILNLNPASSMTLANVVVGTGNLLKILGSGSTIYVTNANPFTGASAVQQGILQISHPNAVGAGSITVGNATGTDTYLALAGDITVTNPITLSGKTGAIVPSPVGINNVPDINSGQPGTNTIAGPITVTGSTCWAVGADAGKLIVNGNFINTQAGALCEFFLRGSAEGVWGSGLKDNSASLRLMLTKSDSGTWTLTGTNTFTGRTAINGGTLIVDGALNGSSNVAVQFGATLGGKGFIAGAVTNTGNLLPGGDGTMGTLTISNALALNSISLVTVEVSTNGNDQIRGLATVVYDGALNVNLAGTLTGNCIFKLFDAQTYNGAFAAINLPDISPLTWDTSKLAVDGTLRVIGAPVITPAITSIVPSLTGGYTLSGTGTIVAPYGILATTNLALPLSSWTNIGGGTFSNGVFLFTDLTATNSPQRFYLLTTPAP